jgi:hypothetical protein
MSYVDVTTSPVTTTSANDIYFAAWVDNMIQDEVRPMNVCRPFFRFRGKENAAAYNFPIQDDPGAGAGYSEGTGLANTAQTTSVATATAASIGMMATLTDELSEISLFDAYAHFSAVLVRSVYEKFETDATALLDDFSNITTTSGVDLTVATLFSAFSALNQRDVHGGQPVFVGHTVQGDDLKQDVLSSNASYWANSSAKVGGLDTAQISGYVGNAIGIPVYQSSLVPTANTAADRAGGLFVPNEALGLYEIRGVRTATQRFEALPGTAIITTQRYGMIEIRDTFGQTVISDA